MISWMRFLSTTLLPFPVLLLAAIAVTGCGGGGAGTAPGTIPAPPIETKIVDLEAYVEDSLRYVWKSSEGYYIPTESELLKFDAVISGLVNQNLEAARVDANAINFQLLRIVDTGAADNELYCLEELTLRGQGFYCIDMDAESSHHFFGAAPDVRCWYECGVGGRHARYRWQVSFDVIQSSMCECGGVGVLGRNAGMRR